MLKTLAGLVAELREVGIPVSPTEHIDAAAAIGHTAIEDRQAVRAALALTLVKKSEHLPAFDTVFDLYFAGRRMDLHPPEVSDVGFEADAGSGGAGGLSGLNDDELAELLYRAIRDGDRDLRALAAEFVTRHAGMEPGRRVAGIHYELRVLRAADVEAILDRLRAEQAARAGTSAPDQPTTQDQATWADEFRARVRSEIRERLVADRGPEDVARTLRRPLPEDLDFLYASGADAAAIRDALVPLARKLAARLARKRRSRQDAPLDIRRTMRRSLSTGGVPVELVFRKPHPSRPELMVLADISGSVATFASFTLQLVYALRSEFARVRTFVFVDAIDEVTDLLEKADNVADATHHINRGSAAMRYGGSDYGTALARFADRWGDEVRRTTTVIILGDARNNYLTPREDSLAAVAARARKVYWLNPEPVRSWGDGDSIIARYAAHCDGVFECRNVRQLRQFVERLD